MWHYAEVNTPSLVTSFVSCDRGYFLTVKFNIQMQIFETIKRFNLHVIVRKRGYCESPICSSICQYFRSTSRELLCFIFPWYLHKQLEGENAKLVEDVKQEWSVMYCICVCFEDGRLEHVVWHQILNHHHLGYIGNTRSSSNQFHSLQVKFQRNARLGWELILWKHFMDKCNKHISFENKLTLGGDVMNIQNFELETCSSQRDWWILSCEMKHV